MKFAMTHWVALASFRRIIHRTTKARFGLKSHSQPSIRSSHRKSASRRKFIIRISTRRAKFVCQLSQLRTGNRLRRQIKVSWKFFWFRTKNCEIPVFSDPSTRRSRERSRARASITRGARRGVSQGSQEVHEECRGVHPQAQRKATRLDRSASSLLSQLHSFLKTSSNHRTPASWFHSTFSRCTTNPKFAQRVN